LTQIKDNSLTKKISKRGNTMDQKLEKMLPDPHLISGLSEEEKSRWIKYLYSTPRDLTKKLNLRNHAIAVYDPFALRTKFRAGRRWCVNIYTGCSHSCSYCYTASYIRNYSIARIKENFKRSFLKDIIELEQLGINPSPIHISNSTDPLQNLENIYHHTLFVLKQLLEHQNTFTRITILTKNPKQLCEPEYLTIIKSLTNLQIEVSCAFYDDKTRQRYEPGAPPIRSRLDSIKKLIDNKIKVSLRLDPIFPRDPLPGNFFSKSLLKDYDIEVSQTEEDILTLIHFAAEVGCVRIITSPVKLVYGRFGKSALIDEFYQVFTEANNGSKPLKKGNSYRLPWELYNYWIEKPKMIASKLGVPMVYCKTNLINTK
jgi:hypothetical protein